VKQKRKRKTYDNNEGIVGSRREGDWGDRPPPQILRKKLYSPWPCTIQKTSFAI